MASGTATSWDPGADDFVNAVDVAGSLVYIGGQFTNVGGQLRLHAAAVSADTAAANEWHPAVNDPLRSISANPLSVALGGSFEAIGGYPRRNLAASNLDPIGRAAFFPHSGGTMPPPRQPGCGGAPEAPGGLLARITGNAVMLSWTSSPSPGVRGYRIEAGARLGEVSF